MQEFWRALDRLARQSVNMHNELAGHINRLSQQQAMDMQKKQIDILKEILTHSYDKSTTYANLIIIAGYVAFFSLWKEVKEFLPVKAALASALLMAISALLFVLYEIFKMIYGSIYFRNIGKEIEEIKDPQTFIEKIQKGQQKFSTLNFRVWYIVLIPTLGTGLSGAAILVYYFVKGLLEI
jgi:hypothetical protein